MTVYYTDTSALAKRYVIEPNGTVTLRNWTAPASGNVIVICELTPVEIFAVLRSKLLAPKTTLTRADVTILQKAFSQDYKTEYISVLLTERVLQSAQLLVAKPRRLDALDGIHLACALDFVNEFGLPVEFVSGDKDLLAAAKSEGLLTHDIEALP